MGKIKDALERIVVLLETIRKCECTNVDRNYLIERDVIKIKEELVTLNNMLCDFGEMLEEQQMAGQDAQLLRVMPAENAGKEALFVVTGDELANLLEACSGATLRMKKKEADKK